MQGDFGRPRGGGLAEDRELADLQLHASRITRFIRALRRLVNVLSIILAFKQFFL